MPISTILACASLLVSQGVEPSPLKTFTRLERELAAAFARHDVPRLRELTLPSYVIVTFVGEIPFWADLKRQKPRGAAFRPYEVRVQVLRFAVTKARARVISREWVTDRRSRLGGFDIWSGSSEGVNHWVRTGGRWRLSKTVVRKPLVLTKVVSRKRSDARPTVIFGARFTARAP